jgi:hypothetical protein
VCLYTTKHTMTIGDLASQISNHEINASDGSHNLQAVGDEFGMFDLLDELQRQYPTCSFYMETQYDPYLNSALPARWIISAYETFPGEERDAFVYNPDSNRQILIVFEHESSLGSPRSEPTGRLPIGGGTPNPFGPEGVE